MLNLGKLPYLNDGAGLWRDTILTYRFKCSFSKYSQLLH